MIEKLFYYFAITIISLIIVIILVIFAPKSKNFYNINDTYPQFLKVSVDENVIDNTFIKLNINLNEDELSKKYEKYESYNKPKKKLKWLDWPDKSQISGKVQILPLFLFSKISVENIEIFSELYSKIKNIKNIASVYFLKISSNSKIKPHQNWKELSNNTLQYIFCFNSFCFSDKECGIWVNGETKKLYKNNSYIYDSSLEHSIYNNTFDDILFLCIDIERLPHIRKGVSRESIEGLDLSNFKNYFK